MKYGKKVALLLLFVLLALSVIFTGCGDEAPETQPSEQLPTQQMENPVLETEEEITEAPGIPVTSEYIVLSYPADLEGMVSVRYEPLNDGQEIIFTTNFTGEDLELFRFSLNKAGTDGYELGVLEDEEAGELRVCVDVKDYENGNRTPEEYTKLTSLQERVNDIIAQFYDDPRFTPAR